MSYELLSINGPFDGTCDLRRKVFRNLGFRNVMHIMRNGMTIWSVGNSFLFACRRNNGEKLVSSNKEDPSYQPISFHRGVREALSPFVSARPHFLDE